MIVTDNLYEGFLDVRVPSTIHGYLLLVALFLFQSPIFAVVVDLSEGEVISVQQLSSEAVRVDGFLKEKVWDELPAYDEFVVTDPDTLAEVPHATLVKMFYSQEGLYVGVEMEQPGETIISRLSGRDMRQINRESINITLDTSGEGRYGFWFGVNLGDSLSDGTVLPERQFSSDWDGAWRGASQVTDDGWSAEFFIPWGVVSMPVTGDVRKLGFYISRKVAYLDERWGWPALANTRPRFMSLMHPLEVRGINPKKQYSVFPFAAVGRDLIDNENRYKMGADFFWRPSTNTQIAATINPDFGAVESDDVVINLTATETFFPEKRLFFLEGQSVFVTSPRADTRGDGVGNRGLPYTMINTRRIGGKPRAPVLAAGESVPERDLVQPVDLIGAVKLTGQKNRIRYGFLGAFEEDIHMQASGGRIDQSGSDYGVARVIYEDNYGGAYWAAGVLATAVLHDDGDALVQGIDAHYRTVNGKLKLDAQFMTSDLDGIDRGYGGFVDAEYTVRRGVTQRIGIEHFDENLNINDLGFLQRNGYTQIRSSHVRTNSGMKWAKNNQFDLRGAIQKNYQDLFTLGLIMVSDRLTLNNLSSIQGRFIFKAESYDDLNSFGNGAYRTEEQSTVALSYFSPETGSLSFTAGVGWQEEMLGGNQINVSAGINWRPSDRLSLDLNVMWADRNGWLLHQGSDDFTTFKAEQWVPNISLGYFFNARQQIRASLQWVGIRAQEDEFYLIPDKPGDLVKTTKPAGGSDSFGLSQMSFQVRYRWELAPLSDLFVVYTRVSDKGFALQTNTFSDLFERGFNDPLGDFFVVKLRYRFGS